MFEDFCNSENNADKKVKFDIDKINTQNKYKYEEDTSYNAQTNEPYYNYYARKRVSLYKTEMCRSFEESNQCKYGERCQFAHNKSELRSIQRHPRYKTEICKTFWDIGTCPYGKRCCFVHTKENQTTINSMKDLNVTNNCADSQNKNIFDDIICNRIKESEIHMEKDTDQNKQIDIIHLSEKQHNIEIKNHCTKDNIYLHTEKILDNQLQIPQSNKTNLNVTTTAISVISVFQNRTGYQYEKNINGFKINDEVLRYIFENSASESNAINMLTNNNAIQEKSAKLNFDKISNYNDNLSYRINFRSKYDLLYLKNNNNFHNSRPFWHSNASSVWIPANKSICYIKKPKMINFRRTYQPKAPGEPIMFSCDRNLVNFVFKNLKM